MAGREKQNENDFCCDNVYEKQEFLRRAMKVFFFKSVILAIPLFILVWDQSLPLIGSPRASISPARQWRGQSSLQQSGAGILSSRQKATPPIPS